jgi:hypothetical protein
MTTKVRHLIETAVDLITGKLKTDLPTALQDIRVNRADNLVTMEPPRDYYIYPKSLGYRTPAVFVIGDRIDFLKNEKQANFIDATCRVNISVLVEDKDAERLMRKSYRYQAAIHQVLDQAVLLSADQQAKMTVVIMNASFSGLYSTLKENDPQSVFRQEIALECDVQNYEQL